MTQRRRKLYQFLVAGFAGAGCFVLGAVAVVTWSYFAGADKSVAATSIKLETAAGSQVAVKQRYRPALNPTIVRQPAADKVRKPSSQELPRQTPSRSATRADGQTKLQSPKLASLTEGKDVSSKVRPPMIALVIGSVRTGNVGKGPIAAFHNSVVGFGFIPAGPGMGDAGIVQSLNGRIDANRSAIQTMIVGRTHHVDPTTL